MRIRCVTGLGNPGPRYSWTRHNAGYWVVDRLAEASGLSWTRRGESLEAEGTIEGHGAVLLKPRTYMNRSGSAVLGALERHQLFPEEMLVVVDDAALPVGKLRLRGSGSAGGHRGLISIEESLGSREYARLRIGVGAPPEGEDLADFLLRGIEADEREGFVEIAERAADAVREALRDGLVAAMNRTNAPPTPAGEAGGRPGDGDREGRV